MVALIAVAAAVSAGQEAETGKDAVMVVDLSKRYFEIQPSDPFSSFGDKSAPPSLFHLTRMIRHAADNNSVKGIYLKGDGNDNEFAASEEIRDALAEFRSAGKFVIAYANSYSQKSYYVASVADKI